ncbi:hypothetical protein Rt10032_c07g3185 [Rhodotorula toruloides]|uniref:Uncharacterized protein n=1 Tax=Rhodotorula toruloides TaxID=5286 RepID=A0A511KFM5_RHOTO|nr:hypothetical protein Rt10032_c07g3185 [Rhodotorula toruloides]
MGGGRFEADDLKRGDGGRMRSGCKEISLWQRVGQAPSPSIAAETSENPYAQITIAFTLDSLAGQPNNLVRLLEATIAGQPDNILRLLEATIKALPTTKDADTRYRSVLGAHVHKFLLLREKRTESFIVKSLDILDAMALPGVPSYAYIIVVLVAMALYIAAVFFFKVDAIKALNTTAIILSSGAAVGLAYLQLEAYVRDCRLPERALLPANLRPAPNPSYARHRLRLCALRRSKKQKKKLAELRILMAKGARRVGVGETSASSRA